MQYCIPRKTRKNNRAGFKRKIKQSSINLLFPTGITWYCISMDTQVPDDQININEIPAPEDNATPWTDDKISQEFQESLKKDLLKTKKKKETKQGQSRHAKYDVQLDRHEAKYIIPNSMVPAIRDFITPFCEPDPHGKIYILSFTVDIATISA